MKKDLKGRSRQTFLKVREESRLMDFLISSLPDQSRKSVKTLLAHYQVSVDNRAVTQFDHPLKPGQQVAVIWGKVLQRGRQRGLKVVFEDPHIIIIEKEPGMLSIATDKEDERTAYRMLSDQLKRLNPKNRVFVVHRLDREASGLMMFAKSRDIQQLLQNSWQDNILERSYAVVVEGRVAEEKGVVTTWLKENRARVVYSSTVPGEGLKAVTRYKVRKQNDNYSLLDVELETGRKNQIRIHMKELGHSIVGDKKYGAMSNPIRRLGLHARVLSFRHPVTGQVLRFETPVPSPFLGLFRGKS